MNYRWFSLYLEVFSSMLPLIMLSIFKSCVYVCVCVCMRERELEHKHVHTCEFVYIVSVQVCMCMCAYVQAGMCM